MHLRTHAKWCVMVIAFILALGGAVFAQGLMSTLTGTVVDQSKAVIPNVTVVLTQESTGATRTTVTNTDGFFSIQAIPSGTYKLTIQAPGFMKWERTSLTFSAGDRMNVPEIVLQVATAEQRVEVIGGAADLVPVDTGEKAQLINQKQIQNLSTLGRSADELLKILPGVVYTNPDDAGTPAGFTVQFNKGIGNYNVAGTRNTQISNVSDGANVIDPGCNCGSAVTPNMDMVQEVKVQTSNFSAENARGPVVFNSVSKSGTADFHGEAYLYARHNVFNSQDWRNNFFDTKKPQDSFYFPGFNIGGPLTKSREKLFFFAGIEIQRQNHDLGVRPAAVPTEAMRKGDFTDAAYINQLFGYDVNQVPMNDDEGAGRWTGNPLTTNMLSGGRINPAYFDKGGQVLMNLLPLPNQDPGKSAGYNYTANIVNPEHRHQELARIDYNISDNTKLYTRFNHEFQQSPYPYTLWWYNSNDVPYPGNVKGKYNTWSSSTSLVKVLDPSTTNEVVFAATYWSMPHTVENPEKVSRTKLGYPYRGLFKNSTDMIPTFTDWGGGVPDFYQPGGLDGPGIFGNKWLISAADNFSKVVATHTMKFGFFAEYVTNDEPTTADDQGMFEFTNWGGNSTGNAFADMLLGRAGNYTESTKNVVGNFRKWELSGYAQDSWKATRRLTLEYGVRIQHPQWMKEKHGYLFGFDPQLYDPNASIADLSGLVAWYRDKDKYPKLSKGIWKDPGIILAPRFGWAYDVFGTGRTVIRGGFGIFNHVDRNGDVFGKIGNPPLRYTTTVSDGREMKDYDNLDPAQFVPKWNISTLEIGDNQIPTTYSWSFTLSNRLPGSTVLEASYVGNVSHHQIMCTNCGDNLNAVPEGSMYGFPLGTDNNAYRPYQNYGTIAVTGHGLSQNYHSLQVTANRQVGSFNFASSYTFSKAMGIGGDSFGTSYDQFDRRGRSYGPLPYDRTHGFSIAYTYLLPGKYTNPVVKGALQGWQISGISQIQSGAPLRNWTMSGELATINPDTGEYYAFDSRFVAGTPDTDPRPYLTCDPRKGLGKDQYVNPACFVAPLPGHNGTYAMPYMKNPSFMNHDLSMFKNFEFSEYKKLQFRFSMFNFPNHPNAYFSSRATAMNFVAGLPDENTLKYFGTADLKRGRRFMQFALKYYF